jgi:peptidoglycan/LPS O-acetylase OafA/YrhL
VKERPAQSPAATPDALRPPPGNPRFPLFDSLRGLAALAIVLTHTGLASGANVSAFYGDITARLDIGVTLFFILSGFLLYRPFVAARMEARPAPRLRDYARRRVLRIVPAYWLALTALAIWPGLVFGAPRWIYYGFGQNYDARWVLGGLGQAWSLAIEASFYVLLPLYAMALARLTRGVGRDRTARIEIAVLALLAAASVAGRTIVHHTGHPQMFSFTLAGTFFWFALGMGLAVCSAAWHGRDRQPAAVRVIARYPWLPWIAGLALFMAMSYGLALPVGFPFLTTGKQYLAEHLLYGTISFLFVLPATFGTDAGGLPRRILASPVLAWLGLVSYGLFLWQSRWNQYFLEHGAAGWVPSMPFFVLTAVVLATSLACAAASYYLVERPLLRFKDRRPRRPPAQQPPAPPEPVLAARSG